MSDDYFSNTLNNYFGNNEDDTLNFYKDRQRRIDVVRRDGGDQSVADNGTLFTDLSKEGGYRLTGMGRDHKTWVGGLASLVGLGDDYHENIEATRAGMMDMTARGAWQKTNRYRHIVKATQMHGMARELGILMDTDGLSENARSMLRGEYSDFGSIQFAELFTQAWSDVFTGGRGGRTGMFGDAEATAKEIRDYVGKAAAKQFGHEFYVEVPKLDKDGNPMMDVYGRPVLEKQLEGTFDGTKFFEWAQERGNLKEIFEDNGITADSFEGIRSMPDAIEAISYKLFQSGQMKRAEATQQEGIKYALAGIEGFGGMIAQDPDIGYELGLELAFIAGMSLLTGGIGGAARGVGTIAKWGRRMNIYLDGTIDMAQRANLAARASGYGGRAAAEGVAQGARNFGRLFNSYRPGTTMGGNIAQHLAGKYGASAGIRHGAFVAGQMLDGAIGGGGAMISNNLYLQAEEQRLYGDSNIAWNDHLGLGVGMGMLGAVAVGYGMRSIGMGGVTQKQYENNIQTERMAAYRMYGDPNHETTGGAIAMQGKLNRMQNEVAYLLHERGLNLSAEDFAKASTWGLGDPTGSMPLQAIRDGLIRQKGAHGTVPAGETPAHMLVRSLYEDPQFRADALKHSKFGPEMAEHAAKVSAQARAAKSKADGKNPELETKIAEGEAAGRTADEVTAEYRAEKIKQNDEAIAKLQKDLNENTINAKKYLDQLKAKEEGITRAVEFRKANDERRARVEEGNKRIDELQKERKALEKQRKKTKDQAKLDEIEDRLNTNKSKLDEESAAVKAAAEEAKRQDPYADDAATAELSGGFSRKSTLKAMKAELGKRGVKGRNSQLKGLKGDEAKAKALELLVASNGEAVATSVRKAAGDVTKSQAKAKQTQLELDFRTKRKAELEDPTKKPTEDTTLWDMYTDQANRTIDTAGEQIKADLNSAAAANGQQVPQNVLKANGLADEAAEVLKANNMDPQGPLPRYLVDLTVEGKKTTAKKSIQETDAAVNEAIASGPEGLGRAEVAKEAFPAAEQATRLSTSLRESMDLDDVFRNERITNPATYMAPRKMTAEEAAAATAAARKDMEAVLPNADERKADAVALVMLRDKLNQMVRESASTNARDANLVSEGALHAAANGTVLADRDLGALFGDALVTKLSPDDMTNPSVLKQYDFGQIKEQIDTTVSHYYREVATNKGDIAPGTRVSEKLDTDTRRAVAAVERDIDDAVAGLKDLETTELRLREELEASAEVRQATKEQIRAKHGETIDARLEQLAAKNKVARASGEPIPDGNLRGYYRRMIKEKLDAMKEAGEEPIYLPSKSRLDAASTEQMRDMLIGLMDDSPTSVKRATDALAAEAKAADSPKLHADKQKAARDPAVIQKELDALPARRAALEERVTNLRQELEDLPVGAKTEAAPSRVEAFSADAVAVRRYQAQKIADVRAKHAAIEAEAHRANSPDRPFAGGHDEASYKNTIVDDLLSIYEELGGQWKWLDKKVVYHEKLKGNPRAILVEELTKLKDEGLDVGDLGNGVKDFTNPHHAARGLYDMWRGKTDGGESRVQRLKVKTDEMGEEFEVMSNTQLVKDYNALQPGRDVEIAGILDSLEYRARLTAVDNVRWGENGAPTMDEMVAFLKSGKLQSRSGRNLSAKHLQLASQIVPPQLRDGTLDDIEAYIDRSIDEMLNKKPVYADFIHDDYGTIPERMGVAVESMAKDGNGWFGDYGLVGGFPFATPMVGRNGEQSLAQSAALAHGLLEPTFLPEILAGFRAGAEAAKEGTLPSQIIRNIDGAQNGVRHAHMIVMNTLARIAQNSRSLSDKTEDLFENIWKRTIAEQDRLDAIEGKTPSTGQKDFYLDLVDATNTRLAELKNEEGLSNALAFFEEIKFFDTMKGDYKKAARKLAKPPVMTLPYGAGVKAVFGNMRMQLRQGSIEMNGKTVSFEEALGARGISIETAARELTDLWMAQKNEQGFNLITQALKLVDQNDLNEMVVQFARRNDPLNSLDPVKDLERMKMMADELVDEGAFSDVQSAFTALQMRARGNAIYGVAQNPEFSKMKDNYFSQQQKVSKLQASYDKLDKFTDKAVRQAAKDELNAAKNAKQALKLELQQALRDAPNRPVKGNNLTDGMEVDEGFYKLAQEMAAMEFGQEMKLVMDSYSPDPAVRDPALRRLGELAEQPGAMPFYEAATAAFNRVEFVDPENALSKMAREQIGAQDLTARLPAEARGVIFQQTLHDWRTRIVTPQTKEAIWKGNKAARGQMDPHTLLDEADSVLFKESALSAHSQQKLKAAEEKFRAEYKGDEAPKSELGNRLDELNMAIETEKAVDEFGRPIDVEPAPVAPRVDEVDEAWAKQRSKLVQELAEEDAKARLHEIEYMKADELESALNKWVEDFIDPTGTYGFGFYNFRKRGNMSVKDTISEEVNVLKGKSLKNYITQKVGEMHSIGIKPENDILSKMAQKSAFTVNDRKVIKDALMDLERTRVKSLALKNILRMHAHMGDAPIVKQADGSIGYTKAKTDEELMLEWYKASAELDKAADQATVRFDSLSDEQKVAYAKAHGDPYQRTGTQAIKSREDLMDSLYAEQDAVNVQRALELPANMKKAGENPTEFALSEKARAERYAPFQEVSAGGAVGLFAIRPKDHILNQIGIPALREQAFNLKEGSTGATAGIMRRIEAGESVVPSEYKNYVSGYDEAAMPQLAHKAELDEAMPTDLRDAVISRNFADFRSKYKLENLSDGDTYQVMKVMDSMNELRKQRAELKDYANKNNKSPEWEKNAIDSLHEKFMRKMTETPDDIKQLLRDTWDTNDLSMGMKLYRYDAESGTAKSLVDSATASYYGDADKAMINTNAYGALRDSAVTLDAMTVVPTPQAGKGFAESTAQLVDPTVPDAYYPNSIKYDDGEVKGYIELDDMMDNRKASVMIIHQTDVSGARTTAGLFAGNSLLAGLLNKNKISVEELATFRAALSETDAELIFGGKAGIMFFDKSTGLQIVDPKIVGRNVRRRMTMFEAEYILQNSSNRYVGEAMEVSAAAGGATIKKRSSMGDLMDDRNSSYRSIMMQHAKEEADVLRFLAKDAKKNGVSFDNERPFFATSVAERPELMKAAARAAFEGEVENAGRHFDTIDPVLREGFGLKTKEDPKSRNSKLIDNVLAKFEMPEDVAANIKPMLEEAYGAYIFGSNKGAGTKVDQFHEGRFFFDILQESKLRAIMQREMQTFEWKNIQQKYSKDYTRGKAIEEAEKLLARSGMPPGSFRLVQKGDTLSAVPLRMQDMDIGQGPSFGRDLELSIEAVRIELEKAKRVAADIQNGYLGDGYASTMLKMATDPSFGFGKAILDGADRLTDSQAANVWKYLQDHDIGAAQNRGRTWDGKDYQRRIVDNAVNMARKAYAEGDGSISQGGSINLYKGDWIDPVTKQPVEPTHFMNGDKFSMLSDSHAALNKQFEALIEGEVLTVPQVRMLRAAMAGMHGDAFKDLRFAAVHKGTEIAGIENVRANSMKELTDGSDVPGATRKSLQTGKRIGDDQAIGEKKAVYHTDGKTDTIYLLKNRLGNDMDVVDVVLHEVGHAAFSRFIPEGSPLRASMEADFNTKKAKVALQEAIILMHGGQTNKAQAMIDAIIPQKGKVDVEEFAAQWFSYDMAARTLGERKTLEAAYSALDKAQPGLAGTIKKMVQVMINFAQRRFKGFASLLKRTDSSTAQRLDSYMDVLRGRTTIKAQNSYQPRTQYFGGMRDYTSADLEAAQKHAAAMLQEYGPAHGAYREAQNDVDFISDRIAEQPTPRKADEDPSVKEAVDRAFDESEARNGGKQGPEGSEPPPPPPGPPAPRSPDDPGDGDPVPPSGGGFGEGRGPVMEGREGRRHFGDFLRDNPAAAEAWFATHVLPMLSTGRADGFDFGASMHAVEFSFSGAEQTSFSAFAHSAMMPNAKTNHTIHSEVMMTVGDAKYPLMQLLSNLLDNHVTGDTVAMFKGRKAKTMAQVGRQLLSETADRTAHLMDELHHAHFGKDKGQWSKRLNLASSEADQLELAQMARTATKLLEDPESSLYKAGQKELASYGPEASKVIQRLRDEFADISNRVKEDAVKAGLISKNRAEQSGLVPLMLRQEVMNEKTTKFAPRLREAYAGGLRARMGEMQDLDGIIAAGYDQGLRGLVRKSADTFKDYKARITKLVDDGVLDARILTDVSPVNKDQKLISQLWNHFGQGGASDVNILKYIANADIADNVARAYEKAITSNADLSPRGNQYLQKRRQRILEQSMGRRSRTKVYAEDLTQGISDFRQFALGRKLGSSAHYHMGDSFLKRSDLLEQMGDMFELNPDQISASLARGVGLDAADAANLSKMFDGIYGLTTRDLLSLVEQMSVKNANSPAARSVENGLDHLHASREQIGGGRPNTEKTGDAFLDMLNKHGNDAAMVLFGGNMGPAMLAETATVMTLQGLPKLLQNPVRFASIATKALTEGLSPIRKTKMLKFLNYAAHIARGQGSIRNIDRTSDATLGVAGRGMSALSRLGGVVYSLSGGAQVQGFNKAFSMIAAQDDLFSRMSAAASLKRSLDSYDGVPNKKVFKRLAREAGFGGNWELASRMVRSGLLDHLDGINRLATETGAHKNRMFDLEDLWDATKRRPEMSEEKAALDDARRAIWTYLDDSVATFMVEPRVLDMNLTENKGWAKFQDIFMSWTRAFAQQKGMGMGMTRLKEGRSIGFGHLMGFAMAQVVWDSIYTSIQEVGRGEDPNAIIHQATTDPVGWYMQKATRLPFFGAYMSQLNAVAVDALRNQSAKMGIPGFGYLGKNSMGIDLTSSPAGGAMLKMMNMLMMAPRAVGDAMTGDYTDRRAMDDAMIIRDALPGFNNMFMKGLAGYMINDSAKSLSERERAYQKKLRKAQQ